MRLKVNLQQPGGAWTPVAITTEATATVQDVATALQAGMTTLPVAPVFTLQVVADDGHVVSTLAPKSLLVETALQSGQRVRVTREASRGTDVDSASPARLRIIGGPDAGQVFPLPPGPTVIGRDRSCDIVLHDQRASRQHARLTVRDTVEIRDTESSNGLFVDDSPVDCAIVEPRSVVTIGDTTLIIEVNPELMSPQDAQASVAFNRSPLVRAPYRGRAFDAPKPPSRPKHNKFPLVAMLAPLIMGVGMFLMTRNPLSVVFVALSPIIAIGTYLDRRITDSRESAADKERFEDDLASSRAELTAALAQERQARCDEVPAQAVALQAAFARNRDLWYRRPEDDAFGTLTLGYGRAPSRHTVRLPERGEADAATWARVEALRDDFAFVDDVPIVASLRACRNVGVAGPRAFVDPVARDLVAQLVCLHSPAELTLVGFASPESSRTWEWLMWLPHVGSTHSPLSGAHCASTTAAALPLVGALEGLIAARRKVANAAHVPAVVVLVEDDAAAEPGQPNGIVERGRLVGIAEDGPAVGVHVLWLADRQESLPAACQAYLVAGADGAAATGFVRDAQVCPITRTQQLPAPLADELARSLAPVVDAGAPVLDQSDIPRAVSFLALAGPDVAASPKATIDLWREHGSLPTGEPAGGKAQATLRALVGQGAQGPFTLDLRTQGPHALVGGTTGAGKSEFLQTWILGLATAYSPARVTFLFVDYKGGTAFADCVQLPHTVGLVTDLSPHLVGRALTSLKAELRYREHLLNRKKAKDLLALERTGDPECPPALIIVVDEFAALAADVPTFVEGVVDVAQRGRSLGLHLVLATQRPAGVITANLKANTNLRVALRMADDADSTDVIDAPLASQFDPRMPGRGAVRTGPGRIALFQTGYAGGHTTSEPEPPRIDVETMTFGPGLPWEIPDAGSSPDDDEAGPTDIARVVGCVIQAAHDAGLPAPRKPWLPQLRECYDLDDLIDPARPGSLVPLGVADDPANQAQHTTWYDPDADGNLAVFGVSGSGKSAFLRSLAYAASAQWAASRTHVYGIDFSTAGLALLEPLPTVGAIIDGADQERIARLLSQLTATLDERAARYAKARAGSIGEYRAATGADEARILLLVDGFSAFRDLYETSASLARTYGQFTRLMAEGRAVGMHVVVSAERPGALPSSLSSLVQRRLVLRQSDENGYLALNVPKDALGPDSPPGRGVFAGEKNEIQVAVPLASATPAEQGAGIDRLAARLREAGVQQASGVERLTQLVSIQELPASQDGRPVLGIAEADLRPLGFAPQGGLLVAGLPASGRTSALRTVVQALRRWDPSLPMFYVGPKRSVLVNEGVWTQVATSPEEITELVATVKPLVEQPAPDDARPGLALVVESLGDFVQTPSEAPLAGLARAIRRNGHLVVGENDTSGLGASWSLIAEVRADRRGLIMQPDPNDGDILFKVPLPRLKRSDYPLGRGVYIAGGKCQTVQLGLPAPAGGL